LKESNKTQEDQYLQFMKLIKLFRYHAGIANLRSLWQCK